VSSTTGDGEQPENVIKFWRKIRPRNLSSEHLAHLKYTILGLGDTNYNQFCNAPQALHRRLTELGAKTFYPPDWADDGTGLEIVVEPWLENLWDAVDNLRNSETVIMDPPRKIDNEMEEIVKKVPEIKLSEEKSYTLPACPKSYLTIQFEDVGEVNEVIQTNLPSQTGDIVTGTVIRNELLSVKSDGKEVKDYHNLVIDCDNFKYKVGDTVGVLCRNDTREVEHLREFLQVGELWTQPCQIALKTDDTAKRKARMPAHLTGDTVILEDVFSRLVDLRAVPKKLMVRALMEHAKDNRDRELLAFWCSKEGANEFSSQVTEQKMTILELFDRAPSCKPPLTVLLEHLPRLLPRPYSISSCSQDTPGQISWIFTRVTDPRPGIASSWMSGLSIRDRISFYPRSGNNFYPPEDNDQDYIMVAAGSGIGPFIGFLKDRKTKLANGEEFKGKCWLFFGCRYKRADNICKDFIKEMLDAGVLTKFSSSFSREEGQHRYVQHSIESERELVTDWLINTGAILYICGDAKGMASGVKETVQKILKANLGEDEGLTFMKKLILEKRIKEDIWS